MTEAEKIEFAQEVFIALATEKKDRLTKGMILRQQMHDSIRRGQEPTGYRPEWLNKEVQALVRHMATLAERFDSTFPDDKCSVADIMDILATVQHLFAKTTRD